MNTKDFNPEVKSGIISGALVRFTITGRIQLAECKRVVFWDTSSYGANETAMHMYDQNKFKGDIIRCFMPL